MQLCIDVFYNLGRTIKQENVKIGKYCRSSRAGARAGVSHFEISSQRCSLVAYVTATFASSSIQLA